MTTKNLSTQGDGCTLPISVARSGGTSSSLFRSSVDQRYDGKLRRQLDIAASLVAAPSVLFLDEPTNGLDPRRRIAVWELPDELTSQGTSLLMNCAVLDRSTGCLP